MSVLEVVTQSMRVTTATITKDEVDHLIAEHLAAAAGILLASNVVVEVVQSRSQLASYEVKLTEMLPPDLEVEDGSL